MTIKEYTEGEETILLIDDDDMIISVYSQILRRYGYKVLIATNGKEAIEIYIENKDQISLVVLDMIMPEMNGDKVFTSIKEINPGVKVLLSSGYSHGNIVRDLMQLGCDGFIEKPFNTEKFLQKIGEILNRE